MSGKYVVENIRCYVAVITANTLSRTTLSNGLDLLIFVQLTLFPILSRTLKGARESKEQLVCNEKFTGRFPAGKLAPRCENALAYARALSPRDLSRERLRKHCKELNSFFPRK